MAKSLNKVMLIGNLGHGPEVRFAGATAVANFSMATTDSWTDKVSGEKKEKTVWHRIVAWGKLGEICGDYLVHGSKVYIEGSIETRDYMGKDGTKKTVTEIKASNMVMLDNKKDAAAREANPPAQDAPKPTDDRDDDIPF